MVWGDWCPGNTGCSTLPTHLAGEGIQDLLTFNEPDNPDQSDMTVARALELWSYLEATGLQLGSPAVTDTAQGSAWLAAFLTGARQQGLRVDFLAVHWYGDCTNPSDLFNYLAQMAGYGLPIWLTEFSCHNESLAVNTQFIQEVTPRLAKLPFLKRIAWFTNRPYPNGYEFTGLLDATGALTSVGQAYSAVPAGMNGERQLVPWSGP